jgi:hypothetical protein
MATTQAPLPGTELSEAEFDLEQAKKCAQDGPVFLTKDERTTHVFLRIDAYAEITGKGPTLTEMLWNPAVAELDDLEIPPREVQEFRHVDFD